MSEPGNATMRKVECVVESFSRCFCVRICVPTDRTNTIPFWSNLEPSTPFSRGSMAPKLGTSICNTKKFFFSNFFAFPEIGFNSTPAYYVARGWNFVLVKKRKKNESWRRRRKKSWVPWWSSGGLGLSFTGSCGLVARPSGARVSVFGSLVFRFAHSEDKWPRDRQTREHPDSNQTESNQFSSRHHHPREIFSRHHHPREFFENLKFSLCYPLGFFPESLIFGFGNFSCATP